MIHCTIQQVIKPKYKLRNNANILRKFIKDCSKFFQELARTSWILQSYFGFQKDYNHHSSFPLSILNLLYNLNQRHKQVPRVKLHMLFYSLSPKFMTFFRNFLKISICTSWISYVYLPHIAQIVLRISFPNYTLKNSTLIGAAVSLRKTEMVRMNIIVMILRIPILAISFQFLGVVVGS